MGSLSLKEMVIWWYFVLFAFLAATIQVHGDLPSTEGFISIDCGIPDGYNYTDSTNIFYTSDDQFIDTGMNHQISQRYINPSVPIQDVTLRSFPRGARNCYTLPAKMGNKYLLRATFMYGDYDGLQSLLANTSLVFDLSIGVNLWKKVNISDASVEYRIEAMTVALADFIWICLTKTGPGTPFISSLELRPMKVILYPAAMVNQTMVLFSRVNYGPTTNQRIRYPGDPYDRIWIPYTDISTPWTTISTNSTVQSNANDDYECPSAVLRNAVIPVKAKALPSVFSWFAEDGPVAPSYFAILYFAEIQNLSGNASREFNIYLNGYLWFEALKPDYLLSGPVYSNSIGGMSGYLQYVYSLNATKNSTLPPLINALEVYSIISLPNAMTDIGDVDAIVTIKAQYQVKRNWTGDPCAPPRQYVWDGLSCSYVGNVPRIISVNLSSSGLSGVISSSFSKLQAINYLDLSYNKLTGAIPDSLANISSLKSLNLTGNNFTGPVPDALCRKVDAGSLKLDADSLTCGNNNTHTDITTPAKKNTLIIVIVSVVSATLLAAVIIFIMWVIIISRKKRDLPLNTSVTQHIEDTPGGKVDNEEYHVNTEIRHFTYMQLANITSGFARVIGRGASGFVAHGYLEDGTDVAVKVFTEVSVHRTKQFLSEVRSLTNVRHKNLVSLVGYCSDGDKLAIVYEYLSQGSLHDYLTGKTGPGLSLKWGERLRVALEAAQGLDYLHTGCRIVHRDVKSSNILLGQNLEAKVSDFGLSKELPNDPPVSLMTICGTPGYIDPQSLNTSTPNESDVYSFGVVLLELLTGKPPILPGREKVHIVNYVLQRIERGDIADVIDGRLEGEYDKDSVWNVMELAMCCAKEDPSKRPTMSDVVQQLNNSLERETSRERNKNVRAAGKDISQNSWGGSIIISDFGPSPR